jgi:DNA mismatch repair ATPase MutS
LAVARFARLPPEVIEAAAKRMAELEPTSNEQQQGQHGEDGVMEELGDEDPAEARRLLEKFAALPLTADMAPDALAAMLREHAIELCV